MASRIAQWRRRHTRRLVATVASTGGGIPSNAMLYENGTPMLYEDGTFMLYEG